MQLKRYDILEPEDAEDLRQLLIVDHADRWEEGKARTDQLTGTIKRNQELKPTHDPACSIAQLSRQVSQRIGMNDDVQLDTAVKKMTAPKFNRYAEEQPGGEYKRHTDAPWMGSCRTDFTVILSLSDPDSYEGGDHHVVDPVEGETIIRLNQGEMVIYETGYPHWVDPVTKGERVCALAWMESHVADARKRGILQTLRRLSQELENDVSDEALTLEERAKARSRFVDVGVVHSGVYRMWASS